MAVVIRMRRTGAKGRPFYRVVVAESRFQRDGRYIEQLGYYDPLTNPATFKVDATKFEQWIRRGAKPSEAVEAMMARHAPEALRPAPLPRVAAAPKPAPAEAKPKAKAKPKKASVARKPRVAKKGSEKKAKTRAKAKAKKATGGAKAKATKKTKK
jgi:small subunit ribosomal protein S16